MARTNEELVEAAATGDMKAFEELSIVCFKAVVTIITSHRNRLQMSEIEDCKNEALEKMFFNWIPHYRSNPDGPFYPYMYQCAKNMIIDKYDKGANKVFGSAFVYDPRHERADLTQDPLGELDNELRVSLLNKHLMEAIFSLENADARRAFLLKLLFSPKDAYAASLLGLKLDTIHSHLHRGVSRMLSFLTENYNYPVGDAVKEIAGSFRDVRVNYRELYERLSGPEIVSVFESIPVYDNLADLCGGISRTNEEVIKMVKQGLDEMAQNKEPGGKKELPADKKAEAVMKGFDDTAQGKRKKKKTRSATITDEETYEVLGEFLYTMFNKRPDKDDTKALPEFVEEQMKKQGLTAKQMANKLNMSLVEFSKFITKRSPMNKKDVGLIVCEKNTAMEESVMEMREPEPFDDEAAVRSYKAEIENDAKIIMEKAAKFYRKK